MLNYLKWIIGAGAAALLFAGGYAVGAIKVKSLEAQIREIKLASDDTAARLEKNKAEIERVLREKEAEYARQSAQLKADADGREKQLAAALAGAKGRVASLQKQVGDTESRIRRLTAERDAAPAAERKKYEDQIAALNGEKAALLAKVDANECLALQVPEQLIRPLMGQR